MPTLREALNTTGARIVTIPNGWQQTIALSSDIQVTGATKGSLTLDGQGVTLTGAGLVFSNCTDLILRNFTIARGAVPLSSPNAGDCLYFNNCQRVLLENVTLLWSVDELCTFYQCQDVTVRYSVFAEALANSVHDEQPHSMGLFVWGDTNNNFTVYRNLIAHCMERPPLFTAGRVDCFDNVVYGCATGADFTALDGDLDANVCNNWIIRNGSDPRSTEQGVRLHELVFTLRPALRNNLSDYRSNYNQPEAQAVYPNEAGLVYPDLHLPLSVTPHISAGAAYADVIANAGCQPRDFQTTRIINQLVTRTGKIIDDPNEVL